ncbi:MAG: TIGR00159 family protein [Papillibacter sp.]|nr:TIGR00159 family protein [Papillibacter sp.]
MEIIGNIFVGIFDYVKLIRPSDILDILIIAFLIYKVLTFLARTGSARVFRGIVLLIGMLWLSNLLDLYVVSFIFGKTFELGILALLILFQPEVRQILERVGSSKLTKLVTKPDIAKNMDIAINQVIQACLDMARTRTGALIIFEREISLADYIKTGTVIDSEPQAELIKNIFYPKAPLHDGAVIIQDGRLTAASCMLPLSSNPNLSRELGMRHKAGIGISESTDAVSVIVSEETGSISVSVEGILKRHLSEDTFEKILRNQLISDVRDNRTRLPRLAKVMGTANEKNK